MYDPLICYINSYSNTTLTAYEDTWIGDLESFVAFAPSRYYIDACEDAVMLLITREKHIELLDTCRSFDIMAKQLSVTRLIETERRVAASISLSAEERYADFATQYPDLLRRFPQYIIANIGYERVNPLFQDEKIGHKKATTLS